MTMDVQTVEICFVLGTSIMQYEYVLPFLDNNVALRIVMNFIFTCKGIGVLSSVDCIEQTKPEQRLKVKVLLYSSGYWDTKCDTNRDL